MDYIKLKAKYMDIKAGIQINVHLI